MAASTLDGSMSTRVSRTPAPGCGREARTPLAPSWRSTAPGARPRRTVSLRKRLLDLLAVPHGVTGDPERLDHGRRQLGDHEQRHATAAGGVLIPLPGVVRDV